MYDFRTLSPLDFEILVRDLLQEELGIRFESFGPGRDLGVDFRFSINNEKAVVQVKHFVESGAEGLIRSLRLEDVKVSRLLPSRYILATSVSLTPMLKARIKDAMPHAPLDEADIFGRADLNNLLTRHPKIERLHFKLWLASTPVLEKILHSGVFNRTEAEIDIIKLMVPRFVHNASVLEAENILKKQGALIISGEPGVGKTTLARMLVWLHAEQDWRVSVIDDIKEAFEVVTEGEKRLIFFDDFLGQVRLSIGLIRGVDQRFPPFLNKVRNNPNLRFILTTREYILRQAQSQSGRLSTPGVKASEFTLNVGHYTRAARAGILYNHIYFSSIAPAERNEILSNDFFLKIIDHRNFNPRLIELLTSSDYLSIAGKSVHQAVTEVLDNPEELWERPYRTHLSDEGRALMLALFFNAQRVAHRDLEDAFGRFIDTMGLPIPAGDRPVKYRSAVKELEGSVLAIQDRQVRFSNPGVRDYLQRAIALDNFLPLAIRAACKHEELKQCLEFFLLQEPPRLTDLSLVTLWAGALGRLLEAETSSTLVNLILTLEIYEHLQNNAILIRVQSAVAQVEQIGIEGREYDQVPAALTLLSPGILPLEYLPIARSVVSDAICEMLSQYGLSLNLEDITLVADSLFENGFDTKAVSLAIAKSLEDYIVDPSALVSSVSSLNDLDSFEGELYEMLKKFAVKRGRLPDYFDSRREELTERGAEDGAYRSRAPQTEPGISDDHIRSMFAGLGV